MALADWCTHNVGSSGPDSCSFVDAVGADATLGVFHYNAGSGRYQLNYTAAQEACTAVGGSLATYTQLSYAQQVSEHNTAWFGPDLLGLVLILFCCPFKGGLNICAAGWLDQARVAYPTTYSNPNCGYGHVGIVDYGIRQNLSETWDAFCYRMKGERRPDSVTD